MAPRELQSDVPAPEDDQSLGQTFELEQFDVRHRRRSEAGNRWHEGSSPEVEEDAVTAKKPGTAVVQRHFERLRTDEVPFAHDQLGAARAVVL